MLHVKRNKRYSYRNLQYKYKYELNRMKELEKAGVFTRQEQNLGSC
jgi:hypothetical protein